MALTLDDLYGAPTDPELLNRHLEGLGLLARPEPPPLPVSPTKVAPMTPPVPRSDVTPMVPPVRSEVAHPAELSGLNRELALGATAQPTLPARKEESLTAPEISAAAPTGTPESGVKTMVPPALTHAEKMALPMVSPGAPDVGSSAYTRNELERLEEQKAHPWGSEENHPGLLGKIAHGAAKAGNIALDVLAPGLGVNIPGTDLNRMATESGLKKELATRTAAEGQAKNLASEEAAREVQTEEGRQRLLKSQTEQSLEKDAEGNITGWKGPDGKLHSLEEEGTPQAIKDIAAETTAKQTKPTIEKMDNGDIVAITPGVNGGKATSQVVYHGDPKIETELSQRTVNGQEHKILINKKTGEDIKDLGAFKTEVSPAGALAQEKAGEEPVIGYDKDGNQKLVSRAEAKEQGLNHVIKATPKDREDAMQNTSVLNDMGKKVKDLFAARKALDQDFFQRAIIANALSHGGGGTIDSLVRAGVLTGASEITKEYVQSVLSIRESALALPKQLTGGARVSEVQADALWKTLPSVQGDSKYAERQIRKFDDNLGRLWKKVPRVEGNEPERAFPEAGPGGEKGGATEWKAPEGAPSAKGVPDGKVLKDKQGNVVARAQGGEWHNPNLNTP